MAAASRPTPETWLLRHWSQQVLRVLGRAHKIFSGRRGELCRHHREGVEDQLGGLGLALNAVVLWNSVYLDAAVKQLAAENLPVISPGNGGGLHQPVPAYHRGRRELRRPYAFSQGGPDSAPRSLW
ncbi:Tn3 family transposase [Streptomyces sp. NPDC051366]|uniref:Tn3 family transposase n=1 Tax=Streptomyces sp. NPDC051366 TaxID=3365652 RepID=UPI0037BE1B40